MVIASQGGNEAEAGRLRTLFNRYQAQLTERLAAHA